MDMEKLKRTVGTAMRMLDNVIDLNFYSVDKARNSNFKHRPVGLGHHGLPGLPAHAAHPVRLAGGGRVRRPLDGSDRLSRVLGFDRSRGRARPYSTFKGSLWDRGILPLDTLQAARRRSAAAIVECDMSTTLDWEALRRRMQAGRHAQLELPRDRADRDDRQHHRPVAVASSRPIRTCT